MPYYPVGKKWVLGMAKTKTLYTDVHFTAPDGRAGNPELDSLVEGIIGSVAGKWTMLVLEVLAQHGVLRFTRLAELVGNISQKMLTKTLRAMESDGFVTRTVHPVVPPRVDYQLTPLGLSLGEAFCGVWLWAERHHAELELARKAFRERRPTR